MPVILEARDLVKRYPLRAGSTDVLRGVSLSVEQGEFVAIMGASGSGKSTMLHLLGGLDRPTSGEVVIDGVNISRLMTSAPPSPGGPRPGSSSSSSTSFRC